MSEYQLFTLHHHLPGRTVQAATFAIESNGPGSIAYCQFQYHTDYIAQAYAIPIMPTMPLESTTFDFQCSGNGLPGFIDDLLPDAWGAKLIAQQLIQGGLERNPTIIDKLSLVAGSGIGCFTCSVAGVPAPPATDGIPLSGAEAVFRSAARIDRNEALKADYNRVVLAGGSASKGARPKVLVRDDGRYWLAKLSRKTDSYDVVLAEHAALQIAKSAGLRAPDSRISEVGGERALLVERFDRTEDGTRLHLVSANALLRDPKTQQEKEFGRYDNLAELIRAYSSHPQTDLEQLLGQALLNQALKNTDDHLRNFSFLVSSGGMRLSPAYDIVPDPSIGAYHQLGWGLSHFLPTFEEAGKAARHLGIPAKAGESLGERLKSAIRDNREPLVTSGALTPAHEKSMGL